MDLKTNAISAAAATTTTKRSLLQLVFLTLVYNFHLVFPVWPDARAGTGARAERGNSNGQVSH